MTRNRLFGARLQCRGFALVAAIALQCAAAVTATAQSDLRVVRRTPADSGSPGSLISVTFDRPVAGMLDHTIDPRRAMSIEPAIPGTFGWRDPVTIRFVPDSAIAPGTALTVSVDTAAVASAGARTGAPYRFSVRIPGPTPLALEVDGMDARYSQLVGPMPLFRVAYSAPADTAAIASLSYLQLSDVCGGRIGFVVVRQRPVTSKDGYEVTEAGGYDRDKEGDRFRRIVELVPTDSLRPSCSAVWHVPMFDPRRPKDEWRETIRVAPEPRVSATPCLDPFNNRGPCDPDGMVIRFGAGLAPGADRSVHVSPSAGPATRQGNRADGFIVYRTRLTPRQTYTITVDSSFRDAFSRRLKDPSTITVRANDRAAGVMQQQDLMTLPRSAAGPSVTIRLVNVDTLAMHVVSIPDSLITELLATPAYSRGRFDQKYASLLRDTTPLKVAVHSTFNVEHDVVISLPPWIGAPGASTFHGVRFDIAARTVAPESISLRKPASPPRPTGGPVDTIHAKQLEAVEIIGSGAGTVDIRDLGLIVQVSDLMAHTKIAADRGAVLVIRPDGTPVEGATVALYGSRPAQLARGVTGADGLVMIEPAKRLTPASIIVRDPSLAALRYCVITKGRERLVLPLTSPAGSTLAQPPAPYSLGGRWATTSRVHGTVLTDRGVYRPGEMVFAKAYARVGLMGTSVVPRGDSIRFTMTAGIEETTTPMRVAAVNAFGSAVDSIRLRSGARPGSYWIRAELLHDGVWMPVGDGIAHFEVAEFRAPEFVVALTADSTARFLGDTLSARIDARYLFGSPMAGAKVRWSSTLRPAAPWELDIKGTSGFSIGANNWWDDSGDDTPTLSGTDSLDRAGQVVLHVPTTVGAVTRPSMLTVSTAVIDANNQAVTSSVTRLVHAASIYVAARFSDKAWFTKAGTPLTVDAFVVRPTGERVSGIPLRVTILRRHYAWRADVARNEWLADTVARLTATSATSTVPIRFTPAEDGAYDVRIEAADEQRRPALTNLGRWVFTDWWYGTPGTPSVKLAMMTQHEPDEPFAIGDVARVGFESPFANGEAWVTVEREAILEQRLMSVTRGHNEIRVPIVAAHAPNAWVGVTLIRRVAGGIRGADSISELTRIGYAELRVDSTAHMLAVTLAPTLDHFAPGDTAIVRVRVRDVSPTGRGVGARSEVAIWGVDEGVLSLTDFKTPDVLRAIDAELGVGQPLRTSFTFLPWIKPPAGVRPGSNVRGWQTYGSTAANAAFSVSRREMTEVSDDRLMLSEVVVADAPAAPGSGRGGPPPALSIGIRSSFRFTAFFIGSAVTDDSGVATIRAKLPDNITTFRLMASAVTTGNRYGSGEAKLLATRNVVVRPALPRFLRYGDELTAAVLVNVRDRAKATLRIIASIGGGAESSGDTVQVREATATSAASAGFQMRVPEKTPADAVRVTFTAADDVARDGDAMQTLIPLRPVGAPRAHAIVGMIRDSGTVSLSLPADIDPDRSTVTFSLGTSPVVAMRASYERLRAYEYLCTEQIVSRARAFVALSRAEKALGEQLVTKDSVAVLSDVQRAVDELVRRHRSGDFAYWPDSPITVGPWLTAYAATFLREAEDFGATVPEAVLTETTDHLSWTLGDRGSLPDTTLGLPSERRARWKSYLGARVVIARYVREAGKPDTLTENELVAQLPEMAWEDRLALVDVMAQRPSLAEAARRLLDESWRAVSVAGTRVEIADSLRGYAPFPSHVRPAARLLTTTLSLRPDHPLIGALAETIIQQGNAERGWAWNTQDYSAAVVSLAELVGRQRTAADGDIVMRATDGRVLLARRRGAGESDSTRALTGLLTTTPSGAALTVSMRSDAATANVPIFYSITVTEVAQRRPVTPDIGGIVVERWYERFDDGKPTVEAREGDLVRVRLRVTVPADRQFVAVEDMLPAGLEPVDLSLRTSGTLGPFKTATNQERSDDQPGPIWQSLLYGSWDSGWWSPWEYKELRDDRVIYFARQLWTGTYTATYVARATTSGTFVRPPAHAEEMYNPAVQGRSDGGVFVVRR